MAEGSGVAAVLQGPDTVHARLALADRQAAALAEIRAYVAPDNDGGRLLCWCRDILDIIERHLPDPAVQ